MNKEEEQRLKEITDLREDSVTMEKCSSTDSTGRMFRPARERMSSASTEPDFRGGYYAADVNESGKEEQSWIPINSM